jgi:hypothetical protein
MTVLAEFVLPPPVSIDNIPIWYRFAQFLVAVLIGLMFVPIIRWQRKRDTKKWVIATVVSVVLGAAAFIGYQQLFEEWTVTYAGSRVVIGRTYSDLAREYKEKIRSEQRREVGDEELLMAAAGSREDIWPESEIKSRGRILTGLYLLNMLLFAVTIMSVIQVVFCTVRTSRAASGT